MFYPHFELAERGSLARIWLAAHWDKKLTKANIFDTSIEESVEGILQPKVKMALRTSGHLLLGVVRIYSRKTKYLLADCNEAFVKVKMAFRPGMVDLPEEQRKAAVNAITLPEPFHDFDTEMMPDLGHVDIQAQFSMNQTRAEEITMREDYGNINLDQGDDGFGDVPVGMGASDAAELLRSGSLQMGGHQSLQPDNSNNLFMENNNSKEASLDAPLGGDDGFGGSRQGDEAAFGVGGLFEGAGLFDEPPMGVNVNEDNQKNNEENIRQQHSDNESDDDDRNMDDFRAPSPMDNNSSQGGSLANTPARPSDHDNANNNAAGDEPGQQQQGEREARQEVQNDEVNGAPRNAEQTTLLQNEKESFALAPVDASALRQGFVRTKRKRRLVVDEIKAISGEEMKAQLSDTTDIVSPLDLAPPTKRLMHWKETGGVEKLFSLSGLPLHSTVLFKNYQAHLVANSTGIELFGMLGESELEGLRLEHVPGENEEDGVQHQVAKRPPGRPRKIRAVEGENENNTPSKRRARAQDVQQRVANGEIAQQQQQHVPETAFNQLQQQNDQEANNGIVNPEQQPHLNDIGYGQQQNDSIPQQQQLSNLGWDESQQNVSLQLSGNGPMTPGGALSTGAPTPFHEADFGGFGGPSSVGCASERIEDTTAEEQMRDDETLEQFEDRVLNKRAAHLNVILKSKLETLESVSFSKLPIRRQRKAMAQNFYSLLVLQKVMAIELEQSDQFVGDITIRRGPHFETTVL